MNKLSDKRIEDLPTDGKVGWGEGKIFFFLQGCNRRDGESKRERPRECMECRLYQKYYLPYVNLYIKYIKHFAL